jgi:Fibronectin type III domain
MRGKTKLQAETPTKSERVTAQLSNLGLANSLSLETRVFVSLLRVFFTETRGLFMKTSGLMTKSRNSVMESSGCVSKSSAFVMKSRSSLMESSGVETKSSGSVTEPRSFATESHGFAMESSGSVTETCSFVVLLRGFFLKAPDQPLNQVQKERKHMTTHLRVVIGFKKFTDADLDELAGKVIVGIPGNKNFVNPPVDPATLQAAATDFHTSIALSAGGGVYATADKNKKRDALIFLLRKLALYVEANSNSDPETILSSGFQPVVKVRTPSALPKPVIAGIDSPNTGQLVIRMNRILNAKSWEVDYAAVAANGTPGTYQTLGGQTNSRALTITQLTPGTTYSVKVRAVGSAGYSDYSDPVAHMCI